MRPVLPHHSDRADLTACPSARLRSPRLARCSGGEPKGPAPARPTALRPRDHRPEQAHAFWRDMSGERSRRSQAVPVQPQPAVRATMQAARCGSTRDDELTPTAARDARRRPRERAMWAQGGAPGEARDRGDRRGRQRGGSRFGGGASRAGCRRHGPAAARGLRRRGVSREQHRVCRALTYEDRHREFRWRWQNPPRRP